MRSIRITGNVFVSNLPPGFSDARLADIFDIYGLVLSAYVARDAQTGALRNHGLVDLAPPSAVSRAIAELDDRRIEGQAITVRAANPALALRPPRTRALPPKRLPAQSTAEVTAHRPGNRPPVVERRPLGTGRTSADGCSPLYQSSSINRRTAAAKNTKPGS
jgi:RNA recognition motif-containing protein